MQNCALSDAIRYQYNLEFVKWLMDEGFEYEFSHAEEAALGKRCDDTQITC